MFRFTQKPSLGSHILCLAEITYLVPMCMSLSLLMLSVLWRRSICRHNTENLNIGTLVPDM